MGQTTPNVDDPIVPPLACEEPAIVFSILSLERSTPGKLEMQVLFKSEANVSQTIRIAQRDTALVDNTNYGYQLVKFPRETLVLPSGGARAVYTFLAEVGGKEAKTVRMKVVYYARTGRGQKRCAEEIRSIPITDVRR